MAKSKSEASSVHFYSEEGAEVPATSRTSMHIHRMPDLQNDGNGTAAMRRIMKNLANLLRISSLSCPYSFGTSWICYIYTIGMSVMRLCAWRAISTRCLVHHLGTLPPSFFSCSISISSFSGSRACDEVKYPKLPKRKRRERRSS